METAKEVLEKNRIIAFKRSRQGQPVKELEEWYIPLAMQEYAEELSKGFARWLPSVGVEIRDGIYYTDLSGFDLDVEQDLFTQLFSLYKKYLEECVLAVTPNEVQK